MNKHIAPYARVSHFIALISSGSCGVSCEQWWGNSRDCAARARREGRVTTPDAKEETSSLLQGSELWWQTWVSMIGAEKNKAGKPPPRNMRKVCA